MATCCKPDCNQPRAVSENGYEYGYCRTHLRAARIAHVQTYRQAHSETVYRDSSKQRKRKHFEQVLSSIRRTDVA